MMYLKEFIDFCRENQDDWYAASDDIQITYSDFIICVSKILPIIDELSKNSDFVVIKCDKSAYTTCFFFAAHLLNKAYIPISDEITESREHYILSTLGVDCAIVEREYIDVLTSSCSSGDFLAAIHHLEHRILMLPAFNENQIAYILFTSGSTGDPKGVQITFKNLYSFVNWATDEYYLNKDDIFLNQVPFTFDLSVMDIYSSFINKSKLVLCNKKTSSDIKRIVQLMRTYNTNIIYSTPSLLRLLSYSSEFKKTSAHILKKILFCGETLHANLANKYINLCPQAKLYNLYGPTETNVVTSVQLNQKDLIQGEVPIGKAMSNYVLFVLGEDGEEQKDDCEGELVICGDSVALGYVNDQEKTNKSFKNFGLCSNEICYKTGDIVVKRENYFYYRGRTDHQFKFMGYRIEAGEIEDSLNSFNGISHSIVIPITDNHGSTCGILAVVETSDHNTKIEDIKEHLKKRLPKYMLPTQIMIEDNFPTTSHGKIDRKMILESYSNER